MSFYFFTEGKKHQKGKTKTRKSGLIKTKEREKKKNIIRKSITATVTNLWVREWYLRVIFPRVSARCTRCASANVVLPAWKVSPVERTKQSEEK